MVAWCRPEASLSDLPTTCSQRSRSPGKSDWMMTDPSDIVAQRPGTERDHAVGLVGEGPVTEPVRSRSADGDDHVIHIAGPVPLADLPPHRTFGHETPSLGKRVRAKHIGALQSPLVPTYPVAVDHLL